MDMNYSIGINVLLKHLAIKPLLNALKRGEDLKGIDKIFPVDDFVRGCQIEYPQYSFNECENIYYKLFGILDFYESNSESIFSLFYKIASSALQLEGDSVSCKHSELLSWRETVHSAGQSIFICAFLAYEDVQRNNIRSDFAFSPYAKSDNIRLRNMLSIGLAENHFHLKGSAPAFLMSWVCLMNKIDDRNNARGFNHPCFRQQFFRFPAQDEQMTLCETTQMAALIRLQLYRLINGDILNEKESIDILLDEFDKTPFFEIKKLQIKIETERMLSGTIVNP